METDDSALPQPETSILVSRKEYRDALDRLIGLVERELRIFDPSLSDLEFNSPQKYEMLRAFLLRGRNNRLYIALHTTDHVQKYCPRMLNLLRQFSDRIFIHQTQDDAAGLQDCFILADKLHFVRRPVQAQPRGSFTIHDEKAGQDMHTRFSEIWDSSFPAISATTAGL